MASKLRLGRSSNAAACESLAAARIMTDGVERNENGLSIFTPFSVYFWRTTIYLGCFRREQTAPANQISGLGGGASGPMD
jgi:hypothetical protein